MKHFYINVLIVLNWGERCVKHNNSPGVLEWLSWKGAIQGVYDFYFEEYGKVFQPRVFGVHQFIKRDETQGGDGCIARCRYGPYLHLAIQPSSPCVSSLLMNWWTPKTLGWKTIPNYDVPYPHPGYLEALTVVVACHNNQLLVRLRCVSLAEKVYLKDALKRPSQDLVKGLGTHGQAHTYFPLAVSTPKG